MRRVLIAALAFSRADGKLVAGIGQAIGQSGLDHPYSDIAAGIAHGGGAIAINSMPVIPGPDATAPVPMPQSLHQLALESLGSAYNTAFLVAGLCALAAALLSLVGLVGHREPSAAVKSGEADQLASA